MDAKQSQERMQAVVFDGKLRVAHRPVPSPAEGDAVVRVRLAGICNTDLEIVRGYMDFRGVLGHEFVGEVASAPAREDLSGKRVVGEINCPCGACPTCERGLPRHCPNRTVLGIVGRDGAFAEYIALPVANLHAVPDSVSDEQAVFTEPLAACYEMVERALVAPDEDVLVLGDGKMGALCAQALANAGARVVCAGRHPEKMALLGALGLSVITCDEIESARWTAVVDVTGAAGGLNDALRAVRPRGRIIVKTTVATEHRLNLAPLVIDEISLIGSRCGPFAPALRALESGAVSVDSLVDATFPLAAAASAFERAAEPGAFKVLLKMS